MMYFSHLLPDEEMKEVIKATGMGVESIEFSIAENLDCLDEKLLAYETRLRKMGCEKLILHGPFLDLNPMSYDQTIRQATMRRYQQAYEAAKKLEAEKLVFHTCYVPDFYLLIGWADRVAEFYREFLADKDDSVELVLENVLDRYPEPLAETAEKVDSPAFGLCLDIGHAHCYSGISCTQWAKIQEPYLKHVHIHDNFQDRDSHLAFGRGSVPVEVIETALKNRKDRTCTIECSSLEAVMTSYENVQAILKGKIMEPQS